MRPRQQQRGQAAVWVLLLLSTVILGTMALTVDVGRMYTIHSELQTVTDSLTMTAAMKLIGTQNATDLAAGAFAGLLQDTSVNANRFNLRINPIFGSPDLAVGVSVDFFNTLQAAQSGVGGGQTGAQALFVRTDVQVDAPIMFLPFIRSGDNTHPQVHTASIAGIGTPLCTVSGTDDIAITAADQTDTVNYGFVPGGYYTMYLTLSQQSPNLAACRAAVPASLTGTDASIKAEYTILNHTPSGPLVDPDGELFLLGATGVNPAGSTDSTTTGFISIHTVETAMPGIAGTTCATATAARDYMCGINVRFGLDPTQFATCNAINDVATLSPLYPPDTDIGPSDGSLQDYPQVVGDPPYLGNARRVITVAIVDSSATLTVLNFRQFLIEDDPSATGPGVNVSTGAVFRGAMRAQYIGNPVPVKLGTSAGFCNTGPGFTGVGKLVLY
jgi:hypothetical protein